MNLYDKAGGYTIHPDGTMTDDSPPDILVIPDEKPIPDYPAGEGPLSIWGYKQNMDRPSDEDINYAIEVAIEAGQDFGLDIDSLPWSPDSL